MKDLLKQTLLGLGPDYESIITTLTTFPEGLTFDKLRTKLVEQENRLSYLRSQAAPPSPAAFATQPHPQAHVGSRQEARGGAQFARDRGRRGRGRGSRGRGRNYGQHGYGQPPFGPPGYGQQPYGPPGHGQQGYGGQQRSGQQAAVGYYPQGHYSASTSHGRPGSVLCNSVFSSLNAHPYFVYGTNHGYAGSPLVD
ncbi:unnamed protein product [Cuscuta europaea]|uniref:Uncharacterized protein n=1 Tax=Cuscuta europaea TaxID=41803 RepID=A0A9P0Z5E3_CUSEU|nr:unnamed protein product [Cuscuta europaea]